MLDRRERDPDPLESLMIFGERLQSELWTALPGIIQTFDAAKQTCTVQPSIQARITDYQGKQQWVNLPILVDCPVFFPRGGGITLTFPIAAGDECLVIFADRCIDAWWQNGGVQPQAEFRMHDLSDGMVLPGFSSLPKVAAGISTSSAQLRNLAGDTFVEVVGGGSVNIHASTSVAITAPAITINGPVQVNGALTVSGVVQAPTVNATTALNIAGNGYMSHHHSGVQGGTGNTGGVV